jgi:3-phosphoshikimate 1-carboxyvinyltransferase
MIGNRSDNLSEYPADLEIQPLSQKIRKVVQVPPSKSITNRALVLAALASPQGDCCLENVLESEDTEVMVAALKQLGFHLDVDWPQRRIVVRSNPSRRRIPACEADLHVANSGTTMRFLSAVASLGQGRYRLDGIPRMRQRPIQDLLAALNQLSGVRAWSEAGTGCPPVVIETTGARAEQPIAVRAGTSSQYLSGLLLASPYWVQEGEQVEIHVRGERVSEPYIAMTVAMLRQWRHSVVEVAEGFRIGGASDSAWRGHYVIEPDASAASYFWAAAAITGGQVTVTGLTPSSLQGDVRFVELLEQMGCRVTACTEGITVHGGPLRGIEADMNPISDTVMTLAAVACFATGPTRIRNVAHIRYKETDRIAALATELRKLGAGVEEANDGLTIHPQPLRGAVLDTYNDHRMAMSLALIGLRVPGVIIRNPACVVKTYPQYWLDLAQLSR